MGQEVALPMRFISELLSSLVLLSLVYLSCLYRSMSLHLLTFLSTVYGLPSLPLLLTDAPFTFGAPGCSKFMCCYLPVGLAAWHA